MQRSVDASDTDTLVVAPTPAGVTRAIAHCCRRRREGASIRDVSLPHVHIDPTASTPSPPPQKVTLSIPDTLHARFVTAPLCYYLGCSPAPTSTSTVTVPDPKGTGDVPVAKADTLETGIATALKRILTLDRLIKQDSATVPAFDVDPSQIRSLTGPERLGVACRHGSVLDAHTPTWPLATYLVPEPSSVEAIPYVLDRLSLVGRPRATPIDAATQLEMGLANDRPRTDADTTLCRPHLLPARIHRWCGAGDPIGAIPTTPAALRTQPAATDRPTVVLVDALTDRDTGDTTDRLERRLAALAPSVGVRTVEAPTRQGLRRVLSGGASVVYVRGHGEAGGLVCRDGILDPTSIEATDVGIAVLNTCSSTRAGHAILDAGGDAAVVTRAPVIEPSASRVGDTILAGLATGFCLERSTRLARIELLLRTDYRVLGDPLSRLGHRSDPPSLAVGTRLPTGGIDLRTSTWYAHPTAEPIDAQPTQQVESPDGTHEIPILLDGTIHWPRHETFSPRDSGEIIQSHR